MKLIHVPLSKLAVSPGNARKANPAEQGLAELAASIKAHGLLSPLIVDGEPDRAVIIGGSRRFAALGQLAAAGDIPADHPVECVAASGAEHLEVSLAENSGREALHPIDQAEAFAALRKNGTTDRELAARFGVSPRTVQRRLRMAAAAPELLARARRGELALGIIEAVLVEPRHERQVEAVKRCEGAWEPEQSIRQLLLGPKPSVNGRLGRFIDVADYEAAGGTFLEDLYGDEEAEGVTSPRRFEDEKVVRHLAMSRLRAAAEEERARGWAQVKPSIDPPANWYGRYRQVGAKSPRSLPKRARPAAEVHLSVGHQGDVDRMVLIPREAMDSIEREKAAPANGNAASRPGGDAAEAGESSPNGESGAHGSAGHPAGPISVTLQMELREFRGAIAREALAGGPADLARDLLTFHLALKIYGDPWRDAGLRVATVSGAPDLKEQRGAEALPPCVVDAEDATRAREAELLGWLAEDDGSRTGQWAAFRAMDGDLRDRLLSCCVARVLRPCTAPSAHVADTAMASLVDWPRAFVPGRPVLSRLTRGQLVAIAERHLTDEDRDLAALRNMKKAAMVDAVAAAFETYRAREERTPWLPPEVFGE